MACTELQLSLNIDHNCQKNDSEVLNQQNFSLDIYSSLKIGNQQYFIERGMSSVISSSHYLSLHKLTLLEFRKPSVTSQTGYLETCRAS